MYTHIECDGDCIAEVSHWNLHIRNLIKLLIKPLRDNVFHFLGISGFHLEFLMLPVLHWLAFQ